MRKLLAGLIFLTCLSAACSEINTKVDTPCTMRALERCVEAVKGCIIIEPVQVPKEEVTDAETKQAAPEPE